MNINFDKPPSNYLYWIIIALAIIIGTVIRLTGLGTWPLALDEYYIIKSSEFILEHGLPQFPNGGFYTRGILLQYFISTLLSFGVKAEFAGRIFSVIANLLTIPAIYLIAKKVGNKLIAGVVILIFCFSIWEIEFARFARMYAPFQAIFTWYIYFTIDSFDKQNFKNFNWLIFLSTLSIFVYEGSVFLAVFNFVPFILNRKFNFKYLLPTIAIFLFSIFANMYDFRTLGSNPIFPPEFSDSIFASISAPPIKIPKILLPFAVSNFLTAILTFTLLVFNGFIGFKLIKMLTNKNFWSISSIVFLVLILSINQFGLFILLFLLFTFWNISKIEKSFNSFWRLILFIFFVNLIYWYLLGIFTEEWYILFTDFSSYSTWGISKRLLVGFFNFPDNYLSIRNYFLTLPLLTAFSAITILTSIVLTINKKSYSELKYLLGVLIFGSLLATIPTTLYEETRYTFFQVVILIIVSACSLNIIFTAIVKNNKIANVLFGLTFLIVFVLSGDFNFHHLTNVDKKEVNYRMIYENNHFKKHLYRRWDILSPAKFVENNMDENDLIMINENSHEYYLPRVDYYNFDYTHQAFVTMSVDYGKRERWSNAKLIYSQKDLLTFIENRKNTIWFTVYPENYLIEIDFYNRYEEFLVFEGIDKMIKVFKFPKTSETTKIN